MCWKREWEREKSKTPKIPSSPVEDYAFTSKETAKKWAKDNNCKLGNDSYITDYDNKSGYYEEFEDYNQLYLE